MVMCLYTAHIPIRFTAVNNSLLVGVAAAISPKWISPTQLTHAYEQQQDRELRALYFSNSVWVFFNVP